MVTNLTIDDDVMRTAQELAAELALPIDRLVSDLLRDALTERWPEAVLTTRADNGFPVFQVPPGTRVITSEAIRAAEEEMDLERALGDR